LGIFVVYAFGHLIASKPEYLGAILSVIGCLQ
jgi:hypothetical protein